MYSCESVHILLNLIFMKPFNEILAVTVTKYSGTNDTDKNGKDPIMLQPLAGACPNRQVLSGTVAENKGFQIGHSYLVRVLEQGYHEVHGRTFDFTPIMEITDPVKVVQLKKELGEGYVLKIDKPEAAKDYQRTTTAVEGFLTKEIKAGRFTPANVTTVRDHSNTDIVNGSSTEGETVDETKRVEKQLDDEDDLPGSQKQK